jgi:Flp pilus assembly pilin Flp
MCLLGIEEEKSMFRKLMKNKKAQNTAEYAILISLVVAGIIAMQTYAQRALQARVRDASSYMKNQTSTIGGAVQYEPYYLETSYVVNRESTETELLDDNTSEKRVGDTRLRESGGYQQSAYDNGVFTEAF